MPRQASNNKTATINTNKHQQSHTTRLAPIDNPHQPRKQQSYLSVTVIYKLHIFTLSILNNLLSDKTLRANNIIKISQSYLNK